MRKLRERILRLGGHRFRALFRKEKLDLQMDDEMRSHIEMQTQENIEAGLNPEEARYAALRQFGWVESIKETCREPCGISWFVNRIRKSALKKPARNVPSLFLRWSPSRKWNPLESPGPCYPSKSRWAPPSGDDSQWPWRKTLGQKVRIYEFIAPRKPGQKLPRKARFPGPIWPGDDMNSRAGRHLRHGKWTGMADRFNSNRDLAVRTRE